MINRCPTVAIDEGMKDVNAAITLLETKNDYLRRFSGSERDGLNGTFALPLQCSTN